MDDFLRRVLEKREAEREASLARVDLKTEDSDTLRCCLCGGRLYKTNPQRTVCSRCGGPHKDRAQPKSLSTTGRRCSTGCGRGIRKDNIKGRCMTCQGRRPGMKGG